jgi:predicted nucleic acid-binding protein
LLRRLVGARSSQVTTNFVLAEAHALIVNRTRRHVLGAQFLERIYASRSLRRIRVTSTDEQHAIALVLRYRDKLFSLTDATSFVVMERLGIRHAFTFDADFAQYGLTIVTPEHF